MATRDLGPDDYIVRVPEDGFIDGSTIIVKDSARTPECTLAIAIKRAASLTKHIYHSMPIYNVILQLICEKLRAKESRFFPYVDSLPKSFDGIPNTDSLIARTHLHVALERRRRKIEVDFNIINDNIPKGSSQLLDDRFNLELFRWATMVYWSRAITLPPGTYGTQGRNPPSCLVPILDIVNHRHGTIYAIDRLEGGNSVSRPL